MTKTLNKEGFLQKVFNYEKNKKWKFEGKKPCIIDFYADWCQPCKILSPILEELSEDYHDTIDVYKIDTEVEEELSLAFDIRSIPTMIFCPVNSEPQMASGVLPKSDLEQIIAKVLKVKK